MSEIKNTENLLQKKWLQESMAKGDGNNLVTDGLLFRGKIYYENGCWHREEGEEERQWIDASRRLMILTKDLDDIDAWDIRQETGRRNTVAFDYNSSAPFYKNLRMWVYGLLNMKGGRCPDYGIASNMDISGPYYEKAPLVRINCKKQCGGASINDNVLDIYLTRYADLLKSQIELYDASILLCCGCKGGNNVILNFVRSFYLTDLECVPGTGNWIYYSPSTRKLVINSYHPSSRIGYEQNYVGMMDAYEEINNNNKLINKIEL